jgi:hypothetical protein
MEGEEIKQLAETISNLVAKSAPESQITVKWVFIIGLVGALIGTLFIGWATNKADISELRTEYVYTSKVVGEMKSSIEKMNNVLWEIRFDQIRRQGKEKR